MFNPSINFRRAYTTKSQIGGATELVSTLRKRSNNFEISQISLKIGTHLWKSERKVGAECGNWTPVKSANVRSLERLME